MFKEIEIRNINHLGIVAGIIDELEIVELINQEARNREARDSQFRRNRQGNYFKWIRICFSATIFISEIL